MTPEVQELVQWCQGKLESAVSQIDLFEAKGVKALLGMPDGSTQDITDAVIRDLRDNAKGMERLVAVLTARP